MRSIEVILAVASLVALLGIMAPPEVQMYLKPRLDLTLHEAFW
jgi:hypothetical protein